MKTIPSEVIKERLAASFYTLDIVSEVERHTSTRLSRPDSKKQFNGACPFEDCSADTNGFIVWPELTERGCHYYCRQCGRMGDILKLIRDIKGLSFSDACIELGIPNPYKEDGDFDDMPIHPKHHVPKVEQWQKDELSMLHSMYPRAKQALQHERARAYLAERSIPFELAMEHGLGYIPSGKDKWCDRIIFPVLTPAGETGYCGRSLLLWVPGMDEDAHKEAIEAHNDLGWDEKIHRWVDTYLQGFFNWQAVPDFSTLVFVEGAFDVLACLATGILNAIPLGTTKVDADMLPLSVENVVMALDTDAPGLKASKDLAKGLRRKGIDVTLCSPPAKDWSAAYRLQGVQGLAPLVDALQVPSEVKPEVKPDVKVPEKPTVQPVEEKIEPIEDITPEIKPYAPVTLPSLPRKACPFVLLEWNGKGGRNTIPCKGRTLENGFCSDHQACFKLLEIGAMQGYPETKIPFKWQGNTLWRTIYAGVENWEEYACRLSTERPSDTREQDVKHLQRQFTHDW